MVFVFLNRCFCGAMQPWLRRDQCCCVCSGSRCLPKQTHHCPLLQLCITNPEHGFRSVTCQFFIVAPACCSHWWLLIQREEEEAVVHNNNGTAGALASEMPLEVRCPPDGRGTPIPESSTPFWKNLVAGGGAGLVEIACMYPTDVRCDDLG